MNEFIVAAIVVALFILGAILIYICVSAKWIFQCKSMLSAPHSQEEGNQEILWNKRNVQKPKKKIKTMDLILIIIGVFLFAFTVYMVILFKEYGMVPDTLITCVFASLAGECGIMGWIKTSKERKRERKWELEDRNDMEE